VLLSLRNTFRRKGRLALTLATLILGGAIFIGVFSVRDSSYLTLDDALRYFNFDVDVTFNRAYSIEEMEREALAVPGVVNAEAILGTNARRVKLDGNDGNQTTILGVKPNSKAIVPTIVEGRWLMPGDENAIVLNAEVMRREGDIKVGDDIVLKIDGRKTTWRVVGYVRSVATGPLMYADSDYLARTIRSVGRAGEIWVSTENHDGASQAAVAKALEDRYKAAGMRVSNRMTITEMRDMITNQFNLIVYFLLAMAILLAIVGGLGLMGTMSLNVLERRREIGVMRAIGAADGAVRQVFLVEGMLIGLISWIFGAVLSIPLSQLMSDGVGNSFMNAPLSFMFSWFGLGIWLVVVIVLSILASALPARSASRISVREVLAYE
jgi:putative ABC transport system permease protein